MVIVHKSKYKEEKDKEKEHQREREKRREEKKRKREERHKKEAEAEAKGIEKLSLLLPFYGFLISIFSINSTSNSIFDYDLIFRWKLNA